MANVNKKTLTKAKNRLNLLYTIRVKRHLSKTYRLNARDRLAKINIGQRKNTFQIY